MTTLQVSQDTIELQNKIISLKLSLAKVIEEREYII
jgi:protein-arginine kinase activator protein McsA